MTLLYPITGPKPDPHDLSLYVDMVGKFSPRWQAGEVEILIAAGHGVAVPFLECHSMDSNWTRMCVRGDFVTGYQLAVEVFDAELQTINTHPINRVYEAS